MSEKEAFFKRMKLSQMKRLEKEAEEKLIHALSYLAIAIGVAILLIIGAIRLFF
jgi:hypothetical protein